MSSAWFNGPPGVGSVVTATPKALFMQKSEQFLTQGRYIDPTNSRDPANTANVGVLEAGLIMGKISATGLYAPSIIGLTGGALTSASTTVVSSAAIATEISRRLGATGTFKITGPPVASGVVRTLTATYSVLNLTNGNITITALGVNCVQTLDFQNSPSGTFSLFVIDLNGVGQMVGPITYNGTAATLVNNINTALNAALGTSLVVASGSAVTAVALTFSGAGYANLPQAEVQVDVGALSAGNISVTMTTPGVDGRFVTGSLIQPIDGSNIPLAFLPDWNAGIKVTTDSGVSITGNVDFPLLPVAGMIDVAQMVNWPADSSLAAWIEGNLSNSFGGKFVFGGVGGYY